MLITLFGFCMGVAGLSIMAPMIVPGQALTPLLFMRLFTGKTLKVVCSDDICRTEN
jgi:hypothetical protein